MTKRKKAAPTLKRLPQRCQQPLLTVDDGQVFECQGCGAEAQRTRDNPYPDVQHRRQTVTRMSVQDRARLALEIIRLGDRMIQRFERAKLEETNACTDDGAVAALNRSFKAVKDFREAVQKVLEV